MGKLLNLYGGIIGAASRSGRAELEDLSRALVLRHREEEPESEILRPWEFDERIGRQRQDLIGDIDELDDDDDDDDAGYIGIDDIIGAMKAAYVGAKLTRKQRKALRKAHQGAKQAARQGNNNGAELAHAMRAAGKPVILTDEENILRILNMPLSTITIANGATESFRIVVQETMRLERLFLYPVGGSYDNLWVGDIFCGRQTNSVVPGNEEPAIVYSATAVDSGIQGFTVNYGLTLRIPIRNASGASVVMGGKIKGRSLTS